MKIIFWILAVVQIPVHVFLGAYFALSPLVGAPGGALGTLDRLITAAGSATVVLAAVGFVLGIVFYRRKRLKAALVSITAALVYGLLLFGGSLVIDAHQGARVDARMRLHMEQLYGENWDAPGRDADIPEHYADILNRFYAVVKGEWDEEKIAETDLYAYAMPAYYGGNAADRIGYLLMDLNADHSEELLIGADDGQATVLFAVYTQPENPYQTLTGAEGEVYYLHPGEAGEYWVEIAGSKNGVYRLRKGTKEDPFDIGDADVQLNAQSRMKLDMTAFSQYK